MPESDANETTMLTLLTEARFWSMRDEDIIIKSTDFGAFRYHDKKKESNIPADIFADAKRDYAEKRDMRYVLDNKRPEKLKDSVKKLEDHLKQHHIVYCRWKNSQTIQLILSNGLLITITIDCFTGDINRLIFDKYFVGKLVGDNVNDALITRLHILLAYNQNQLTFVYLHKLDAAAVGASTNDSSQTPDKINEMDPKIYNVLINGPQNRPMSRQLSCNCREDLVVVWTKSSQNEVYPWRPTIRDQDRANVHIYKLTRIKLEALCYYWTENDPICVEFSTNHHNQLHSIEQKISRKGEVIVDVCIYEIKKSRLQRIATTAIPLQTQVCCHSSSPDNEKIMLGCIDGSLVIFDESRGITHLIKAAFIPTLVTWHCDSAVLTIANERGQMQCFDISLACIRTQMLNEDCNSTAGGNLLDLSAYFVCQQPTLLNLWWNSKPDPTNSINGYGQCDGFLLLYFEDGPLVCLRFVAAANFRADILVDMYLALDSIEKAINLLLCLNWDVYGQMCLIALNDIANYILTRDLTTEREIQLEKALGSFLVPVKPLSVDTDDEFSVQVRHITRRFFFYMLRFGSYEKAFSLAIDINDADLFYDLQDWAESDGHIELARDAESKAKEIEARQDQDNSGSDSVSVCSNSSCSECADSMDDDDDDNEEEEEEVDEDDSEQSEDGNDGGTIIKRSSLDHNSRPSAINVYQIRTPSSKISALGTMEPGPPQPSTSKAAMLKFQPTAQMSTPANTIQGKYRKKAYVPPLPHFSSTRARTTTAEIEQNAVRRRINIPKPELKVSAYSKNQHRNTNKSRGKHHSTTPTITANATAAFPAANFTPDNILLVDPPLPMLLSSIKSPNINRSSNSCSIAHGYPDFISDLPRTQLYLNNSKKFSTENLRGIDDADDSANDEDEVAFDDCAAAAVDMIAQRIHDPPPTALPRATALINNQQKQHQRQQQHTVIDVVPKPCTTTSSSQMQQQQQPTGDWEVPDQTLGIPLTYTHTIPARPAQLTLTTSQSSAAAYHLYGGNGLIGSMSNYPTISNENLYTTAVPPVPIIHQYPIVTGNIPSVVVGSGQTSQQQSSIITGDYNVTRRTSSIVTKDPLVPPPILSNANLQHHQQLQQSQQHHPSALVSTRKESGEKNKVKFSDTVTVAVVPEIPRKDKSLIDRMKRPNGFGSIVTDPKKELADSLPLCSPNDEYLKDFTPMTTESNRKSDDGNKNDERSRQQPPSTIKVVHFGVV